MKLLKLFIHFLKISWMQAIEYRADYITWTLVDVGWTTMDIIFFTVLVSRTGVLGDWTLAETMVVIGLFRVMVIPVWMWMFQSFRTLPETISEGRLDLILVKPVSSQFLVSVRGFGFSFLPTLIGGIGFMVAGFNKMGRFPNLIEVLAFGWFLIISTALMYSIYFAFMATSLYFDRLNNIYHIFPVLYDASRYPKEIYSGFTQRIFTTAVPVALMLAIPAEVLFGRIEWIWVAWFHMLAIGFFILGQQIWSRGLKRYTSASS